MSLCAAKTATKNVTHDHGSFLQPTYIVSDEWMWQVWDRLRFQPSSFHILRLVHVSRDTPEDLHTMALGVWRCFFRVRVHQWLVISGLTETNPHDKD